MASTDGLPRMVTGSITGTGASLMVSLGFVPSRVEVFNIATAGRLEWMDTMPSASAIKTVTAGTQTYITSNGITPVETSTSGQGFLIGADAVNGSGNTLVYFAVGN